MNWHDVLPEDVAIAQISWERDQAVARMKSLGFKFKEIAARLNTSPGNAQRLHTRAMRHRDSEHLFLSRSPIERYLNEKQDARLLAHEAREGRNMVDLIRKDGGTTI